MTLRTLSVVLLSLLGACAAGLTARDSASLRVEGQRITVVAPQGLCIDPTSPDVGRAGGFVLIGDCALFTNAPEAAAELPGVMTVSISTGGLPGDIAALEEFLRGPGKSGLSRARDASSVRIIASRRTDNALFLKLSDRAPGLIPGAAQDYWRVFFPAAGRLVTGALVAFSDAEIPDSRALALLSDLENRTTAANPVIRPEAPAAAASEVTEPAPAG
ncbi:hypothetical protein [Oceanibium sediminis]|uniref:hypothetical protein n=1 Tax=Oceanibium sediminis TaxID=2026339 RepID=UPI000DD4D98C|nr:hypothetical protein [Oceanibium sediminis]